MPLDLIININTNIDISLIAVKAIKHRKWDKEIFYISILSLWSSELIFLMKLMFKIFCAWTNYNKIYLISLLLEEI